MQDGATKNGVGGTDGHPGQGVGIRGIVGFDDLSAEEKLVWLRGELDEMHRRLARYHQSVRILARHSHDQKGAVVVPPDVLDY